MTTTCNHSEKNKANCCQGPQHIACFRLERPWKKMSKWKFFDYADPEEQAIIYSLNGTLFGGLTCCLLYTHMCCE